jgi:glycerol-3-phosphate acyltransferase PlsY
MALGVAAIFYLLGSIPLAWIMGKLVRRNDIRNMGSGNVGVMNVALSVARWAGVLVFLGEAAKGALAVVLARSLGLHDGYIALAVVMALVGTSWSIWLGGAGGRGNTLGMTAILVLAWPVVLISLALWVVVRLVTRRSFIATRVWIFSLSVSLGLVTGSWIYALMGIAISLIYLSAHKVTTDDHTIIKETWPNLWAFLTSPPRDKHTT